MRAIVEIEFGAHRIPGGAATILGPAQCGSDVVEIRELKALQQVKVTITLDDKDPRISKILSLLAEHGEEPWFDRKDIYTEDDLQSARLLCVVKWMNALVRSGPSFGTNYDMTHACTTCGTGARQTSPLIVSDDGLDTVEQHRIAGTNYGDLLIRDADVERLTASKVTGANFWPASAKQKNSEIKELRWQQAIIESVMPPMAASSFLDRRGVCPTCNRGGFLPRSIYPRRLFYRNRDLIDIRDFNVTWEWFGEYGKSDVEVRKGRWPDPLILVTPKVMNLLRGKTKKEQKYQGCDFIPIWIEG